METIYIADENAGPTKARLFLLDEMNKYLNNTFSYPANYNCHDDKKYAKDITTYIKKCQNNGIMDINMLRRGDVIRMTRDVYRNDATYIWDGEKALEMNSKIDEYGTIPTCFNVLTEFPITFWDKIRAHNNIVPFDYNVMNDTLDQKILLSNQYSHAGNNKNAALLIEIPVAKSNIMKYDTAYIIFFTPYKKSVDKMKEHLLDRLKKNKYTAADKAYEFEDNIPNNIDQLTNGIDPDRILWIKTN